MGALKGYVPRNNKLFPVYYNEEYEHYLKCQKETEEREKEQKGRKRRAKKEEQEEIFPAEFDDEAIQEEQDKKTLSSDEVIESIINKEGLSINDELFKKHFKVKDPSLMYKVLSETNDKEKKIIN